ncbi:unnamed protein product [Staurois parvus]|uniref:Uncharacterized protein n=1 Tax=Staurois parvus TaxID=386267 RepID=A0ABN9AT37_9NEOB|nr:unnamed protein product [Staurois parvus]
MGLSSAITIIGLRAHARYSPMVVVKEIKIIFLLWKPARTRVIEVFVLCVILYFSILIH